MDSFVAQVAVAETAYHFDKPYDYLIPKEFLSRGLPGCRVLVPFGKGNRKRQGVILSVLEGKDILKLKPIKEVLDKQPVFSDEMLKLGCWLADRTFCTLFDALKAMLPAGVNLRMVVSYRTAKGLDEDKLADLKLEEDEKNLLLWLIKSRTAVSRERLSEIIGSESDLPERLYKKGFLERLDDAVRKVGDATLQMVRLSPGFDPDADLKLTEKQKSVVNLLSDVGSASVKELGYFLGITKAVPDALHKKGLVEYFDNEVFRSPYDHKPAESAPKEILLTNEQKSACARLLELSKNSRGAVSLLYGVTGSGKTQVFLKLIDHAVADGQGVIVMVPEIALTPQTLSIFYSRYGDRVAVFHSAMSLGQRLDEWKRVKNGQAVIAVGTRSAVFAPFPKLGLIIMDEEQEHTYKSEASPRFHAREVAKFRSAYHKCPLILASATPSLETYSAAKTGRYHLCCLTKRYGGAKLPEVIMVDMREEIISGNAGMLSEKLTESLIETYNNAKQAILLLNRRGHNTFVSCRSCSHVITCPYCSISLTYHSANGRLICHYCGYSGAYSEVCPECGSKHLKYSGYGTQRAEKELTALLPNARILRMDADTTLSRFAHEKRFSAFANGDYDIMLGTQMVAKGLDFPNVTLVGVLNADQSMYNDDYRAYERTFSLLTQVIGRSGRGENPGIAVIQTITPENAIIRLAASQDYDAFYQQEILTRKLMTYPPYCDICMVGFVSQVHEEAENTAKAFFEDIKQKLVYEYAGLKMIILGPAAAAVPKVSAKYRYRLLIKCKNDKRFRELIAGLLKEFGKKSEFKNTTVYADMNPETIL